VSNVPSFFYSPSSVRELQQLRELHVRRRWSVRDSLYPESTARTRRRAHQRDPSSYQLSLGRSVPPRAGFPAALKEEQAEEATAGGGRHRGETEVARGLDHLSVGVPAEAAAGSGVLSALYQVDESRAGCLQAGRQ